MGLPKIGALPTSVGEITRESFSLPNPIENCCPPDEQDRFSPTSLFAEACDEYIFIPAPSLPPT